MIAACAFTDDNDMGAVFRCLAGKKDDSFRIFGKVPVQRFHEFETAAALLGGIINLQRKICLICRKKPPEKRMVNMIKPMRPPRPAVRKGVSAVSMDMKKRRAM